MAIVEKKVGKLPVYKGDWSATYNEGHGYMVKNRVTIFGSELESLIDNNTYVPATRNEQTGVVTFEEHWKVISNGSQAYAAALAATNKMAELEEEWDDQDQRMTQMQATINAKQLEVGAVQTDEVPTENSGNHMTSGDIYQTLKNSTKGFVDDEPTAGSGNLIKSGGVQKELALGAVYDVSAKNPTAGPNSDGKWESLSALLSDNNLNTLIPTSVRKGGMSIKYVQSSDNKYVQYRLMSDSFSIAESDWQGVDSKIVAGSRNLAESGSVDIAVSAAKKLYYDPSNSAIVGDVTRCILDYDFWAYIDPGQRIGIAAFLYQYGGFYVQLRKQDNTTFGTYTIYEGSQVTSGIVHYEVDLEGYGVLSITIDWSKFQRRLLGQTFPVIFIEYGLVSDNTYVIYKNRLGQFVDNKIAPVNAAIEDIQDAVGYKEVYSANRFDKTAKTDGKSINGQGDLYDDPETFVSDFMYVGDMTSAKWGYFTGGAFYAINTYCEGYNANKEKVGTRILTGQNFDVTNYKYIRIAAGYGNENINMLIKADLNPTVYIPYLHTIDKLYNVKQLINEAVGNNFESIVVDINGSGDFTSLRSAVESISDASALKQYNILIKEGTYDVFADYSTAELQTEDAEGLVIPDYVHLIGVGDRDKTIIKGELTTGQGYAYNTLSPINLRYVNTLKNLTVTSKNCRYAVHDDPAASATQIKRVVENCRFIKYTREDKAGFTIAYGSGVRANADVSFVNCDFVSELGAGYTVHDNRNFAAPAKIKLEGCNMYCTKQGETISAIVHTISNKFTSSIVFVGCYMNKNLQFDVTTGLEATETEMSWDVRGYANSIPDIDMTTITEKEVKIVGNGILVTE